MIGNLNQEVRFCLFVSGLSDNNTPIRTETDCYVDWVKIEQLSSSRSLEQAQINFSAAYRVTKRHYAERPVNISLTEIEYNSKMLSIHSLKLKEEGRRTYEEMICYCSNNLP